MTQTTSAAIGLVSAFSLACGLRCADARAADADAEATDPPVIFENLTGERVLDNPRVSVEKFVLQPGQSTGRQWRRLDQLWVFVKGGVLTSGEGRAVLWRDGRVLWRPSSDCPDGSSTNTGAAPMTIICVNLKPWPTAAEPGKPKYRYLNYPDVPGEDLLENDLVIVQRFTVNPGQWEGVHAHPPDTLYIHVKGGQWSAKTYKEPEHPYPKPAADGAVGWMPTIDLSVGHQSRNIGKEPIDLIWVTLKR